MVMVAVATAKVLAVDIARQTVRRRMSCVVSVTDTATTVVACMLTALQRIGVKRVLWSEWYLASMM